MEHNAQNVIIVRKKVKKHGGHHGGAWKVAYADFVTAMMALFIVLWLMTANEAAKKAIAGYFKDPTGNGTQKGTGAGGVGEDMNVKPADMNQLKDKIEAAFKKVPEFKGSLKERVQMTVTGEGLRIEFLEDGSKGLFFQSGSEVPTDSCHDLLAKLAQETSKLPNALLLEGHTDSHPFTGKLNYTNWELSADRANAARRVMVASGLKESQISQVRGFADQRLKVPNDPANASNRRISVVIQYGKGEKPAKASEEAHGPSPAPETAAPHA